MLLLLILCTACGGGGGTPTAPGVPVTPTPVPIDISGVWTGTATSLADSGTCVAQLSSAGTVPSRWVFTGAAGLFQGTETLNDGLACEFSVSVSGNSVALRVELARSRPECGIQEYRCVPSTERVRLELDVDRTTFGGEISGNRMELSGTAVWRAYDVSSGRRLEDYSAPGVQSLTKN